ncbi:MAG: hypothetical protein ABI597_07155 [Gammaproteobacteria bacterium]
MKNALIKGLITTSLLVLCNAAFADSTAMPSASKNIGVATEANAQQSGPVTATIYFQINSYYATGGTGPTWDLRIPKCPFGSVQDVNITAKTGGADPAITTATGTDMYGKAYNLSKCMCTTRNVNDCPTGVYPTGNLGYTGFVKCKATIEGYQKASVFQTVTTGRGTIPDITGNNIYLYCRNQFGNGAAGCNNVANPPGATAKAIAGGYTPVITTYAVPYPRCN